MTHKVTDVYDVDVRLDEVDAFEGRRACGWVVGGTARGLASCAAATCFFRTYAMPARPIAFPLRFTTSGVSGVPEVAARYADSISATWLHGGTMRTLRPFPASLIVAGASSRRSHRRAPAISETRVSSEVEK